MCEEEIEAHIGAAQLDYRRLWLEDANTLGLVAETLACALGWQPSPNQPLPDPLQLAGAAADRLAELERIAAMHQPQLKGRKEREFA